MKRNRTAAWILVVLVASTGAGIVRSETISYDASVAPDDPSLAGVFSYNYDSGASFSCSNGELTIRTFNDVAAVAWFGNHMTWRTVPWQIASDDQGNFLSVRAKLLPNSGQFDTELSDSSRWGYFRLVDSGHIEYLDGSGHFVGYELDTLSYHTYAIRLQDSQVTYWIDSDVIYSGASAATPRKYILIGDPAGYSYTGYGSMVIDQVIIQTDLDAVPLPAVAAAGSVLLGGLLLRRKPRHHGGAMIA